MANTHSLNFVRASSQSAYAGDSASLSFTGNFTIEFWVNFNNLPSSGTLHALVTKDDLGSQRSYWTDYFNNSGTKQLRCGFSSDGGTTYSEVSFNYNLSTATWTHVAFVVTVANSNATKIEMFINGTSQGNGSHGGGGATSVYNGTANLRLGNYDAFSSYLDAKLDDVRVWNTTRTGTQINDNKSVELVGNESGLVAYYKLNNAGTDSTSNANNLTLSNSPTYSTDVPFTGAVDVTVSQGTPPSIVASIPSYTVTAIRNVSISQGTPPSVVASIPTYTVKTDVSVAPAVQSATFSIPTYTVVADGGVVVSPAVKTSTFSIPSYSVSTSLMVIENLQVCTFSIPTYTVTIITGVTVTPSVQVATFSIPTYRIIADYWEDKFTQPANAWSNKFTQPANGWNDKY